VSIQFNDRLELPTQRKFLDSGQMVAPCSIARTGIMYYKAKECGALFNDRDPDSIVKVMTRGEQLFAKDSLDSYFSAPITIGHPGEDVTVANTKELRKGHLDGTPFEDGQQLSGVLVLDDAEAIGLVESGTVELSSGHTCNLVLADANVDWDAEKVEIKANHIALVNKGRAGSARIADEENIMELEELKIKLADEEKVSAEAKVKVVDLETEIATAKGELAQALRDLDEANSKIVDEQTIESMIENRVKFVKEISKLSDMDVSGMSEVEAKRAAVEDVLKVELKDKSDQYIEVRYEILLEDSDKEVVKEEPDSKMADELAKNLGVKDKEVESPAVVARNKMIERNSK